MSVCLATKASAKNGEEIRYAVVGDSYSNGEGATAEESWPSVLTKDLAAQGWPIKLVANPSVTGWTTEQALEVELPIFLQSCPTFATLQIGVNDWVQGSKPEVFRARLSRLLDLMQAALPNKGKLLVVNIPDFSVTPTGAAYGGGRDISQGLAAFNQIIAEEAHKRGLIVVDLFSLSQKMGKDPSLVSADGLHPSAREYAEWERLIAPAALRVIEGRK